MKLILFIVRLFKISRCKRVRIKDYFTGEFSPNYICNGRQWICCFNVEGLECRCWHYGATDDMPRCQNEGAIRRAMIEAEI